MCTSSPSRALTLPDVPPPARPQHARAAVARSVDAGQRTAAIASSYGGSSTPASVKIAVTSSAGVTSKARLKRRQRSAATSAGSRSSIGIAAPAGVAGVERRQRRGDVERHRRGGRPARPADRCRPCWPRRRWRRSGRRRPRSGPPARAPSACRRWSRRSRGTGCRLAPAPRRSGARPGAAGASRPPRPAPSRPLLPGRAQHARPRCRSRAVASGPVLQWVSARSPGAKRSAPSSARRRSARVLLAVQLAGARERVVAPAAPARAPSRRLTAVGRASRAAARPPQARSSRPAPARRRRRCRSRARRAPPACGSQSATSLGPLAAQPALLAGSARWSSTQQRAVLEAQRLDRPDMPARVSARPGARRGRAFLRLYCDQARLLQVLAGDRLGRLLVEVDAGVQLLHHLVGQALVDLRPRPSRGRARPSRATSLRTTSVEL